MKTDIKNISPQELANYLQNLKYPKYHFQQIFSWIYQKGIENFSLMSDIPLGLREALQKYFYLSAFKLRNKLVSKDNTRKYLFEMEDKNTIESVLILHRDRNTVCLSTQVGCKYTCLFCASGSMGFVRNLNQAEILNQIIAIKKDIGENINNIVFMGMGEPLANYDILLSSIRIIIAKYGFHIGQRKTTISTVGLIEGIRKLSCERLQVELSISLHSADEGKRNKIIPISKKYPLAKLMPCLEEFMKLTKRKITFEYLLLGGFNTGIEDAEKLVKLARRINCKVNLIPLNPIPQSEFSAPRKLEVLFFNDYLIKNNIDVTIRQSRGQDIEAACGQLRLSNIKQDLNK